MMNKQMFTIQRLGKPEITQSDDGLTVLYEFADGKWTAFERSPPVEVMPGHSAPTTPR